MGEPKCRPIAFYPWEVKATLEGRKTRFSRVMSFQPDSEACVRVEHFHQTVVNKKTGEAEPGPEIFGAWWDDGECGLKCPFGAPGDRLWCRETWRTFRFHDKESPRTMGDFTPVEYKADGARRLWKPEFDSAIDGALGRWRPSIHMPRWASRITLEVTGVRVERLQEISEGDTLAEGIQLIAGRYTFNGGLHQSRTPQEAFFALIDAIHGEGTAALNPWVWRVEFRRVEFRRVEDA